MRFKDQSLVVVPSTSDLRLGTYCEPSLASAFIEIYNLAVAPYVPIPTDVTHLPCWPSEVGDLDFGVVVSFNTTAPRVAVALGKSCCFCQASRVVVVSPTPEIRTSTYRFRAFPVYTTIPKR
jgi:hypothetical protein